MLQEAVPQLCLRMILNQLECLGLGAPVSSDMKTAFGAPVAHLHELWKNKLWLIGTWARDLGPKQPSSQDGTDYVAQL